LGSRGHPATTGNRGCNGCHSATVSPTLRYSAERRQTRRAWTLRRARFARRPRRTPEDHAPEDHAQSPKRQLQLCRRPRQSITRRPPMRTTKKMVLTVSVVLPALAALSGVSSARSIGAYSGHPLDGMPLICYTEFAGSVSSSGICVPATFDGGVPGCPCGSGRRWEVSLPIENAGTKTVTFASANLIGCPAGGGQCSGSEFCQAFGVDQINGTFHSSAGFGNSSTSLALASASVTVSSGGYLFLACTGLSCFSNGQSDLCSQVGSINWNN
jgi:hypothetical protein